MKNLAYRKKSVLLLCVMLLLFAAPMVVTAAPTDAEADAAEEAVNVTVEYRYAQGGTADIPETITRFGREYKLLSQSAPVAESTLPRTRTYTYKVYGNITEKDLASVQGAGDVKVTPVDVVNEREVDKTTVVEVENNDVDELPETQDFKVSSGTSKSGEQTVTLKRAGVSYETLPLPPNGLPSGYKATIVWRGVESYSELGYYSIDTTFTTTESVPGVPNYVIAAVYEPVVDETPAEEPAPEPVVEEPTEITDTTTTVETPPTEVTPEPNVPESEFSPEDQELIDGQSGNPLIDVPNGLVPAGSGKVTGAWSVVSFLLSIVAVILAVVFLTKAFFQRGYDKAIATQSSPARGRKNNTRLLLIVTTLFGFLVPVVWLTLDDLSLPIVWFNRNSYVVLFLFVLQLVFLFSYERNIGMRKSAYFDDDIEVA
jgi:hypothetical protein